MKVQPREKMHRRLIAAPLSPFLYRRRSSIKAKPGRWNPTIRQRYLLALEALEQLKAFRRRW